MRMSLRSFAGILLFACLVPTVLSAGTDEDGMTAKEKAFSASMENCTLVGSFTVDGKENKDDKEPLKAERYEIESAVKANDNIWIFTVRIKYGNLDTKLPVSVPLEWAGDTPMVTLTDAAIPGLGEGFSARVLFYKDRYAGTWQHGPIGGHMFGRIEHKKNEAADRK
ncbi:MAG: hypothetical protein U0996_14150 [Planctomycetaceae bacterium]